MRADAQTDTSVRGFDRLSSIVRLAYTLKVVIIRSTTDAATKFTVLQIEFYGVRYRELLQILVQDIQEQVGGLPDAVFKSHQHALQMLLKAAHLPLPLSPLSNLTFATAPCHASFA
jgi:hypothetical protein